MKLFKAVKSVFFGEKDEGCLEVRAGYSTAALAFLVGPRPAQRHPKDFQEGCGFKILDIEITPRTSVEVAVATIPKGALILFSQGIVKTTLVAGGTTVTWSLGTSATPAKYGSAGAPTQADSLLKNSKFSKFAPLDTQGPLSADESVVVTAAATGGAADGDTAFTAGVIRFVIVYLEAQALKDYDA